MSRTDKDQLNERSYDRIAGEYLEKTRDRSVLAPWMHRFKGHLPPGGPVIDLGAGPCHRSAELRELGLSVISTDRSWAMLNIAREEFPGWRVQADMHALPFASGCAVGIWANASLLHIGRAELGSVLSDIRRVLVSEGVLFASFKWGAGERWETAKYGPEAPRWFTYWSEPELDAVLTSEGFKITEAVTQGEPDDRWIIRLVQRDTGP